MVKVYLSIGSNVGNKLMNIKKAVNHIKKSLKISRISPIYDTEPVGYKKQGWFLNCAVEAETDMGPFKLLSFLKSIEKRLKRKKMFRYGPRTMDIDIIFYGNKMLKSGKLMIPHPRMHRRLFVLEPLSRISPNFAHPKYKKTIGELKNKLKSKKEVRLHSSKLTM